MKWMLFKLTAVALKVRELIQQAEAASEDDPDMQAVAGQVWVGDIYALRDGVVREHDDGWGRRCYNCESGSPFL